MFLEECGYNRLSFLFLIIINMQYKETLNFHEFHKKKDTSNVVVTICYRNYIYKYYGGAIMAMIK